MDKIISEMTVEEIREEIRLLRERRAARRDTALARSAPGNGKEAPKPRRKREIEALPDELEGLL